MQPNHDKIVLYLLRICFALFAVIIVILCVRKYNESIVDSGTSEQIVSTEHLVTWVAHVPNDFADMELVTVDYENDVAYYRYIGDKVTPEVGDILYLYDDTTVTVSSVTDIGFTIESDDPSDFYVGLSNTPVKWEDGTIVGYVSQLLENGHVSCIWR